MRETARGSGALWVLPLTEPGWRRRTDARRKRRDEGERGGEASASRTKARGVSRHTKRGRQLEGGREGGRERGLEKKERDAVARNKAKTNGQAEAALSSGSLRRPPSHPPITTTAAYCSTLHHLSHTLCQFSGDNERDRGRARERERGMRLLTRLLLLAAPLLRPLPFVAVQTTATAPSAQHMHLCAQIATRQARQRKRSPPLSPLSRFQPPFSSSLPSLPRVPGARRRLQGRTCGRLRPAGGGGWRCCCGLRRPRGALRSARTHTWARTSPPSLPLSLFLFHTGSQRARAHTHTHAHTRTHTKTLLHDLLCSAPLW